MDLDYGEAAETLRGELRRWLDTNLTDEIRRSTRDHRPESFVARRRWNAVLVDAGWGAVSWPVEFGGRGADVLEQLVYNEEMARAEAPGPVNAIGVANIAPALMGLGTDEQKARFIRPMLRGDEIWSQGMSEPDAGSDLASLRCRADRDGDHFVINGQKTWNSLGHLADWCQLYVRTDSGVPKHAGITCLLVDMRTPGIEARPITTMAGTADFADVFFRDVRVPVAATLGRIDGGWAVATTTLSHERAGVANLSLMLRAGYDRLCEASAERRHDPVVRQEMAARYTDSALLRLLAMRTVSAAANDEVPGAEGSVVKLAWSSSEQSMAVAAGSALGVEALSEPWAGRIAGSRSLTIAGGTTEVNKNIIGERVLGLPREPKGDP